MASFTPPREGSAAQCLRIVLGSLECGVQPPDWAVQEVVKALGRYDAAEVSSVGEAFGFPWNKHLAARRAAILAPKITLAVEQVQRAAKKAGRAVPLQGGPGVRGAFEIVGEKFSMAPATVKKYRDAWLKHCSDLGLERLEPGQPAGDADQSVASAIVDGLKKPPKE